MKLTPRDRRAILLGASVLAVLLVGRFAVLPWLDSWTAARDRAAASHAEVDRLQAKMRRLIGVRGVLEGWYGPAVGKPLDDVQTARLGLLEAVQKALAAAGSSYRSIDPQPVRSLRDVPGVALVPVQLRAAGSLDGLAKLLAELPKAERLILVERLQAQGNSKEPGELDVTIVLATPAREEARP